MSKYYTPTIEEFHVGFEVEHLTYSLYGHQIELEDQKWVKKIIKRNQIPYDNNGCTLYRVKYLDREDIESFGFTYDKTSLPEETQWKFYKDNVCLYYRPNTKELGTFTIDPSKNDYMMKHVMDNKQCHIIIIKNKSELKKLLNQLKII